MCKILSHKCGIKSGNCFGFHWMLSKQRSKMADCACSGIRSCLLCESRKESKSSTELDKNHETKLKTLVFCIKCRKLCSENVFKDDFTQNTVRQCSEHECVQHVVSGITVIDNFITKNEEDFILKEIEKFPWRISQSGRKKQDFGPKVNFKKQKLKMGNFTGLPHFCQFIVQRLNKDVLQLKNFHPVELCNLDYCPGRGSSIDPHIDDTWIWGEHLVTINLLSDTILTLTESKHLYEIRIPMPRLSLLILKEDARNSWMHAIKREDIRSRRIAVTMRELSEEFLCGDGYTQSGRALLELASSYDGLPTSK